MTCFPILSYPPILTTSFQEQQWNELGLKKRRFTMLLLETNKAIRFTADRIGETTITFIVKTSSFISSMHPEASVFSSS
jgi:hypothetical protein